MKYLRYYSCIMSLLVYCYCLKLFKLLLFNFQYFYLIMIISYYSILTIDLKLNLWCLHLNFFQVSFISIFIDLNFNLDHPHLLLRYYLLPLLLIHFHHFDINLLAQFSLHELSLMSINFSYFFFSFFLPNFHEYLD